MIASPPSPTTAAAAEEALKHLQDAHPDWRIWRTRRSDGTPGGWVASRRVEDDVEPVIHADTAAQLAQRLAAPRKRYGRTLSEADLAALQRALQQDR